MRKQVDAFVSVFPYGGASGLNPDAASSAIKARLDEGWEIFSMTVRGSEPTGETHIVVLFVKYEG